MGISLIANRETSVPLSVLSHCCLQPSFSVVGYKQISKIFSLKSIVTITALAVAVAVIPYPTVTYDKILVAVFGGFFLGAGIGLAIRGGAVIDGTEVLAIF